MRFGVKTKHLHLVITYRETDEDEHEVVTNLGGDFDPADGEADVDLHFGFAPVVTRA